MSANKYVSKDMSAKNVSANCQQLSTYFAYVNKKYVNSEAI